MGISYTSSPEPQVKGLYVDEVIPTQTYFDAKFARTSDFLAARTYSRNIIGDRVDSVTLPVWGTKKDVSLAQSMISLGSLPLKLNPASTMLPIAVRNS